MSRGLPHNYVLRIPGAVEGVALGLIAILSSTISLKLANVQLLEFIELGLLLCAGFRFLRTGMRMELSRGMYRLTVGYLALFLVLIAGCALSFTRPFYLDTYGMNSPGFVTFARLLELALGSFATVLLTEVFRRSQRKCLFTAKLYFITGTASALLSAVGFVLHGPFTFFLTGRRASGFYNEGGPYGLYLLSVVLLGFALSQLRTGWKPGYIYAANAVNLIGLALSASKAAYIAIVLLLLIQILLAGGHRQRVINAGVSVGALLVLLAFTDVSKGINGYIEGGRRFEAISQLRPDDVNFSYGRVAALFFVPRMVAQHPLLGVGFANYGLVRNAPEYRGNAAVATFIDHDGLGVPGLAAEIGLPAVALLLYLLFQPAVLSRRLTGWKTILALAFLQPLAHLCGAQLNVTYPWVVSALAMGLASVEETHVPQAANAAARVYPKLALAPGTNT